MNPKNKQTEQPEFLSTFLQAYSISAMLVVDPSLEEDGRMCSVIPPDGNWEGLLTTTNTLVGERVDADRCGSPSEEFTAYLKSIVSTVWPGTYILFVGISGTEAHYIYLGKEDQRAGITADLQKALGDLAPLADSVEKVNKE